MQIRGSIFENETSIVEEIEDKMTKLNEAIN